MRTTIQRLFSAAISRNTRPFTVLAIETSADDTGAAVLTSNREILSNVVVKQNALYVPCLSTAAIRLYIYP